MGVVLVGAVDVRSLRCSDVTELLDQWGRWSCSGVGTGGLSTPSYDNDHWIDDNVGLWVDGAMGKLRLCDDNRKASGIRCVKRELAVRLYYKDRYNIPMLANALKVGETKAKTILLLGESWIEGCLGLHEAAVA